MSSKNPTNTAMKKRNRIRYHHSNPLFDSWLKEWHSEAKEKDSKMKYIFAKARQSLKLFPLPVYSGSDCKILKNFGDKICTMIDKRLAKHELENGPVDWEAVIKADKKKHKSKLRKRLSTQAWTQKHKNDTVIPNNVEVIEILDPVMDPPQAIKIIPARKRTKGPTKAAKVQKTTQNSPADEGADDVMCSSDDFTTDNVWYRLSPGDYTVKLCVDCAETNSKASKKGIIKDLSDNGVDYDVRKLHVADFAWIAQEKTIAPGHKKVREIILPYLVERKRMDDLASSIKDGRCREQKHRLLQTGVSSIVYLVESKGQNHASLPLPTCYQAVANTSIVDRLLIKWTEDHKETAAYLTLMTRVIENTYRHQTLVALKGSRLPSPCDPGCTTLLDFTLFNNSVVKNRQLTVQEMLAKHLLQMHGLSVQKVTAIVKQVQTPSGLLQLLSTDEGVPILSELKGTRTGKVMGVQMAETIRALYRDGVLR